MIKKFAIVLITTLALTLNVQAGSDGELLIKKNSAERIFTPSLYPQFFSIINNNNNNNSKRKSTQKARTARVIQI